MKPVRLLIVLFGIAVLLCAIALGLVMTPPVQRWALLRAVRDVPDLKLEVGSVSGGFSGVTLQGLRVEHRQIVTTVARLDADFSVWSFVFGRNLDIDRLHASGVQVDATRVAPRAAGTAAGAPAAGPGILAQLQLPFDLALDDVRIEGRALLPGNASPLAIEADYTIAGGGFHPGREGLLQLTSVLRDPAPDAEVAVLRVQAGLRATLTSQRTFNKISLTSLADAEGRGLAEQNQLKISADLFQSSTGENHEIAISTLSQGTSENVLTLHAELPTGGRQYAGDWELKARTVQLAPFFLGWTLPEFDARGRGRFSLDPESRGFALQGDLRGQVSQLEVIEPAWRAFGLLKIDSSFDVSQQDALLQINRFKGVVSGEQPVVEVSTAVPIRYDFTSGQLLPGEPGSEQLLHATIHGLPIEWLRPFVTTAEISGNAITGQLDLVRAGDAGAAVALRGNVRTAEFSVVQDGRPLLTKAGVALETEASVSGGAIHAPLLNFSVTTPAGDSVALNGQLTLLRGQNEPVSFKGRLNALATQLLAQWLPGGPVTMQGEVDVAFKDGALECQPGRLELRQETTRALFNLVVKQPFTLDFTTYALAAADAAQPVARIELARLPLTLLPEAGTGVVLGGSLSQGDFELSAPAGEIVLRAVSPLRLTDVSLTQDRQVELSGLSLQAQPMIEYSGAEGIKIQTGDLLVRTTGQDSLLALKADVTQVANKETRAAVTFVLEIPALTSQPLFSGARAVSAGRATGEIRAVFGTNNQVEARMTLNGLMTADTGQTLPVANLSFRGLISPSGAISIEAPLLLDNAGQRSDLNFAVEASPLGPGYSVDGRLTGQHVELKDLLGLLGVFVASAAPDTGERPVATGTIPPDTAAAWERVSGQLKLGIESVTSGQDWAMTGLTGTVQVEPTRLWLNTLEASFGKTSRLAAKMEMRFTGGAMPYRLTGDYALNEFDAGRLFKALDPTKAPTVEGLFNVKSRFSGNGETIGRAIDRVHGELDMTSSQGIFRGLQRTTAKISMTSKAVELGASVLGSILGSGTATKTAEKVAGQAYFVDQLAQSVGEFNYDQLSLRFSRDELLNMNLEEISLISPEIRLTGRGHVSYVVGKPLLEQPLTASLAFAARGKVEQVLGKLHLLDGAKDELGYARTKETITLAGSLNKPDPTAFFARIASAKLGDFLEATE